MNSPQRRRIVWLGELMPEALAQEARRYQLESVAGDANSAKRECQAKARAVLVPYDPDMRTLLADLLAPVLSSGALLGVVLENAATEREDRARASEIMSTLKRTDAGGVMFTNLRTLNGWVSHEIVQRCLAHDPGPAPNLSLVIENLTSADATTNTLLQRAFHGFERITLEPLLGGLSVGSSVWKILAFSKDGHPAEPFVVKLGPRQQIVREIHANRDFVVDHVPFPNRPPVQNERCVSGMTDQLLVSRFVDRALRLDEFVARHAAAQAIIGIFDGPLRNWRSRMRKDRLEVGRAYMEAGVCPKPAQSSRLSAAFAVATAGGADCLDPDHVIGRINGEPSVDVLVCLSHGDLHLRNVFIRTAALDAVLIDFSHAGFFHSLRDPAKLDVSIGFWYADDESRLDDGALRALYRPSCLRPNERTEDKGRTAAIQSIRRWVSADCLNGREYDLAVACHLLQYACLEKRASHLTTGALAYECASSILKGLNAG